MRPLSPLQLVSYYIFCLFFIFSTITAQSHQGYDLYQPNYVTVISPTITSPQSHISGFFDIQPFSSENESSQLVANVEFCPNASTPAVAPTTVELYLHFLTDKRGFEHSSIFVKTSMVKNPSNSSCYIAKVYPPPPQLNQATNLEYHLIINLVGLKTTPKREIIGSLEMMLTSSINHTMRNGFLVYARSALKAKLYHFPAPTPLETGALLSLSNQPKLPQEQQSISNLHSLSNSTVNTHETQSNNESNRFNDSTSLKAILTTFPVSQNELFVGESYIPFVGNYTPSRTTPTHLRWSLDIPWSTEFGGTIVDPQTPSRLTLNTFGTHLFVLNSTNPIPGKVKFGLCWLNGIEVGLSREENINHFQYDKHPLIWQNIVWVINLESFWGVFFDNFGKSFRPDFFTLTCNENLLLLQPYLTHRLYPQQINGVAIHFGHIEDFPTSLSMIAEVTHHHDEIIHLPTFQANTVPLHFYPNNPPQSNQNNQIIQHNYKNHKTNLSSPLFKHEEQLRPESNYIDMLPTTDESLNSPAAGPSIKLITVPPPVIFPVEHIDDFDAWLTTELFPVEVSVSIPINFTIFSPSQVNEKEFETQNFESVENVGQNLQFSIQSNISPKLSILLGSELRFRKDTTISLIFECPYTRQITNFISIPATLTETQPIFLPKIARIRDEIRSQKGFVPDFAATNTSVLFILHLQFKASLRNLSLSGRIPSNQITVQFPLQDSEQQLSPVRLMHPIRTEEAFMEGLYQRHFHKHGFTKEKFQYQPRPEDITGIPYGDFRYLANHFSSSLVDFRILSTIFPSFRVQILAQKEEYSTEIFKTEIFVSPGWRFERNPDKNGNTDEYSLKCNGGRINCRADNVIVESGRIQFELQRGSPNKIHSLDISFGKLIYSNYFPLLQSGDNIVVSCRTTLSSTPNNDSISNTAVETNVQTETTTFPTLQGFGVVFAHGSDHELLLSAYGHSIPKTNTKSYALFILIGFAAIFFIFGALLLFCFGSKTSDEDIQLQIQTAVDEMAKSFSLYRAPDYDALDETQLPEYDPFSNAPTTTTITTDEEDSETDRVPDYDQLVKLDALGKLVKMDDFIN